MLQRHYTLSRDLPVQTLLQRLREEWPCRGGPPQTLLRGYYDSFDWRLHAAGGVMVEEGEGDAARRYWLPLAADEAGDPPAAEPGAVPRFADQFPPGPLRERLAPLMEMRALLPVARLRVRRSDLALLNDDDKTVVRLGLEEVSPVEVSPVAAGAPLPPRLTVAGVRGYAKPFRRLVRWLEGQEGVEEAIADGGYGAALERLGRQPGDYSTKLDFRLDLGMRSDAALKEILLHLLDTMERNEEGLCADLDSEFLHDFRVAVRRSRSAVGQIKGVFPEPELERFRDELGWLGRITGPTRDLDVYLLQFGDYRASLPPASRDDLEPLHDLLLRRQRREQARLAAEIAGERYRRFKTEWRAFLASPPPSGGGAPENAGRPIIEVVDRRVWRLYRRLLDHGRAIGPETPAEVYHELRKDGKKLRYVMEFFHCLYPPEAIQPLLKVVKRLLGNLGELQDLAVQMDSLRHLGEELLAEGGPAATLIAMGQLVEGLREREAQGLARFAEVFAHFDRPDHHARFRALFHPESIR